MPPAPSLLALLQAGSPKSNPPEISVWGPNCVFSVLSQLANFICFLLPWVLVSVCGLFSSCGEQGNYFLVVMGERLTAVAPLVAEQGSRAYGLQ